MKIHDTEHYLLKYVFRLVTSDPLDIESLDCENVDSLTSPRICSRDQEICILVSSLVTS